MPNEHTLTEISETVGAAVRKYRESRGLSIEQVSHHCAAVGAMTLTVNALYVIENGRRESETGRRRRLITVDELLALAVALGVHPVDLLVPPDLADDAPYSVTPDVSMKAGHAREWFVGQNFLVKPKDPVERARMLQAMPPERAAAFWDFDQQAREGARIGEQNRRQDPTTGLTIFDTPDPVTGLTMSDNTDE